MAIELDDITSGYNLSKINTNFQKVEDYINDKVLHRADTGVAGEAKMARDLDMDGHTILNADLDGSSITNDRAIRVPTGEPALAPLPDANTRKGKVLTFDINTGLPVVIAPASGSAVDVLNQLALPTGAGLVGTTGSITVQQKLNNLDTDIVNLDKLNYSKYLSCAEIQNSLRDGVAGISIDCFGDSTMWGSTSLNSTVQNTQNPPAVLKKTLDLIYSGNSPVVNNRAIPGTALFSMLAGTDGSGSTFDSKMSTTAATVIMCNHAQNDCNSFLRTVEQFKQDCVTFVNTVRKYNKVPVIVTPNTSVVADGVTEDMTKRLPAFVNAMREVAKEMKVDLVDNFYYWEKSMRNVKYTDLLPDGVHPSTRGYSISGRNLAIPLVAAKTLYKAYDNTGFTNVSYFDNIQTGRAFNQANNDMGSILIGVASGVDNSIQFPLILDNPTDDTVLAMVGLQWGSGSTTKFMYGTSPNIDKTTDSQFAGTLNQRSDLFTDYQTRFLPQFCSLDAGLQVLGLLANTSFGSTQYTMSGWELLPRTETTFGFPSFSDFTGMRPIMLGDTIKTQVWVNTTTADTDILQLSARVAAASPIFRIRNQLGVLTAICQGTTISIGTVGTTGPIPAVVKLNYDKTISITVGTLSATFPALTYPLNVAYFNGATAYMVGKYD